MEPNLISDIQSIMDFQKNNQKLFPSESSLRWFCRVNRKELVDQKALIFITGRVMVRSKQFIDCAVEIGARNAMHRLR